VADVYFAAQQAAGKIRLTIERLAGKYVFHARVLERFKVIARPEVGTMAVTVSSDDILLLHNPAFVLTTLADQLGGVLLHEVHHVVLGHVLVDPADLPDDWARTVAEEVSVNEFVHEPLPNGAVALDQFTGLPPMESTRRRYDRLKKFKRRRPISSPHNLVGHQGGGENDDPQPGEVGAGQSKDMGKAPATNKANSKSPAAGSQSLGRLQTVDDHSPWQEARRDPQRSQAAIRDVIRQAALEVGHDKIPPELLEKIAVFGIGRRPGQSQQDVECERGGRLDWRRLLRRHVGQVLEVRPVFNRPPRRFPELVGVVPGHSRQATRPKIMAVIDTSGSIGMELLELISGELARLARHFTVKVVECDAAIQRVYNYRPIKEVHGRGGTDFRPPLKQEFLHNHRVDMVIYFTDGLGPAPQRPPRLPVIWCLSPEGEPPAPWGKVIRMGIAAN